MVLGAVIGGAAFALSANMQGKGWAYWCGEYVVDTFNAAFTVVYISGIALLMHKPPGPPPGMPLADIGKMALTSYLMQTLFGLLLFYQVGLALFLKTSPGLNALLCFGLFAVQVLFCPLVAEPLQLRPAGWLWRSATFFKWQPMVKA